MITVVDYGAGNLRSVVNAVEALGRSVRIATKAEELHNSAALILPGVGAFGDGIDVLRKRELAAALTHEVIEGQTPYLGICLGMQFLATESLENGVHRGFGWLPGTVRRIVPEDPRYKVPHIGWNTVDIERDSVLFEDLVEAPTFYFVHGYYLDPDADGRKTVTSTCWHGVRMAASVEQGHVFAVQFHPEKSQRAGLKVLENFLRAAGA